MSKKSRKKLLNRFKPKRKKRFVIGKCFNCGYNLEGAPARGLVDNIPVYVDCPKCESVNNFRKKYLEWLEKYK